MIPIKNEYVRDTISVKVFINIHDSFNILKLADVFEKSQEDKKTWKEQPETILFQQHGHLGLDSGQSFS